MVGTQDIKYSINGGSETDYQRPIRLNQLGLISVNIVAKDKLGNETKKENLDVFVK